MHTNEKTASSICTFNKSMKCDIAYFQETHFDQNIENEINFNTDFNVYGSIGTSASRGG
jgi:hypothetical protein